VTTAVTSAGFIDEITLRAVLIGAAFFGGLDFPGSGILKIRGEWVPFKNSNCKIQMTKQIQNTE